MYLWLILALLSAALELFAVSKNLQALEYIAKPAVMLFLFLWLHVSNSSRGVTFWFDLGILFSLAGDVLLISFERMFLIGLIAFLLAHIAYLTGFFEADLAITVWSLILAVIITTSIGRLLRRIVAAMQTRGEKGLVLPVITYGTVISMMLFAAISTLFNSHWKTSSALLVSLGALLFCASDAILAWNRFVSPIRNGRMWNISLYYLGQIGLIAGVITQFR